MKDRVHLHPYIFWVCSCFFVCLFVLGVGVFSFVWFDFLVVYGVIFFNIDHIST